MTANLFTNRDGASAQAQAVLAYLSGHDGIEASWSTEYRRYMAEPRVSRWENCREQGYVVWMTAENGKQINVAFFEHRNNDSICAILWEQSTINAPNIDTMDTSKVYRDKWDISHMVKYSEAAAMADWIFAKIGEFWEANKRKPKP